MPVSLQDSAVLHNGVRMPWLGPGTWQAAEGGEVEQAISNQIAVLSREPARRRATSLISWFGLLLVLLAGWSERVVGDEKPAAELRPPTVEDLFRADGFGSTVCTADGGTAVTGRTGPVLPANPAGKAGGVRLAKRVAT
jgi:hypothetical protein